MKDVEISILISATIPQLLPEVVDIGLLRPGNIPLVSAEDMLVEVDLGHKRPATIPLAIGEQELTLKGEMNICIRPENPPPITKATVVDC